MRSTRYKQLPYESAGYRGDGSPDYLQWWYFDAEFESGHRFMTIMLPRVFGRIDEDGNGPVPGVTLALTDPDLKNYNSRRYYPGEFSGHPQRMEARFAQNSIECRDGRYHLSIEQDGLGCELTYIPRLPPWPPLPGRGGFMSPALVGLSQMTLSSGKYFHYASMIPRGRVEGRLILPGGEVKVEGEGYHEQGRANSPLQKVFTYWYWTRFFIGEWTFVMPVAESPRRSLNAKMRALLVYHEGEPVADIFDLTGLLLNHRIKKTRRHPASGRDVPVEALFSARRPGFRLKAEMELYHERECFLFEPFGDPSPPLVPVWFQHLMRVKVEMRLKGKPIRLEGEGVFETMFTGAV